MAAEGRKLPLASPLDRSAPSLKLAFVNICNIVSFDGLKKADC